MTDWLKNITEWIVGLIKALFVSIWDFFTDLVVRVVDWILSPIGDLIAAIPAPSFMQGGGGLSALLSGFPPFAQYIIGQCNIGPALAVIGAAVSFRLLRKAVTLFQW